MTKKTEYDYLERGQKSILTTETYRKRSHGRMSIVPIINGKPEGWCNLKVIPQLLFFCIIVVILIFCAADMKYVIKLFE
jgi:hypothetical protein